MPEARIYSADDLRPGLKVSYEVEISEEDILTFAQLTGDQNPLHVDSDYAAASNYGARIVHGAFQVGLASALLGMHLPGQKVLLGTINSRFPSPLYFPGRVRMTGEIASWNVRTLGGQLKVLVQEINSLTTTAEIFMGFTLHEDRIQEQVTARDAGPKDSSNGSKLVVLSGASGGLGTPLIAALSNQYHVLALLNRRALDNAEEDVSNVEQAQLDMASTDFEDQLSSVLDGRKVYGFVHAAWPGAPRGSLLQSTDEVINGQVTFGTTVTVRLARTLFQHADPDGGRFVAIGSTAGSFKPYLPLGVYSLGKACLESTVRLLAPELARRKITINAVCPSFMPVGINKQASERQMMMESATIPIGRLCDVQDVVGMIKYLLSPEASFVSGQVLALTGGQL